MQRNTFCGSASIGAVRTEAEQQKVLSESATLTEEDWNLYTGEYEGQERYGGIIRVVRQGNELRGYYSGLGDREEAVVGRRFIPVGNHNFKRVDFKQTWEFVLVDGKVTRLSRVDGQFSVTFKKIE